MFNFNSTSSQYQNTNPNLDQKFTNYSADQHIHDSTYFDEIANYLMSNEDEEESGENSFSRNKDVSRNATYDGSSSNSSTPIDFNFTGEVKNAQKVCRFAFRTKTDLEFMDDGFKWRKYGKKMVKNSPNPRNYFKCSSEGCFVKKRVERDSEDASYVITTYQGMHNHETPNCVFYGNPPQRPSSLLHASSFI